MRAASLVLGLAGLLALQVACEGEGLPTATDCCTCLFDAGCVDEAYDPLQCEAAFAGDGEWFHVEDTCLAECPVDCEGAGFPE